MYFVIETESYIILGLLQKMGRASKMVRWIKILVPMGRSEHGEPCEGCGDCSTP